MRVDSFGVMQDAQHGIEHSAYLVGMQVAYAYSMEDTPNDPSQRPIRRIRQARLEQLVSEWGSASGLALAAGTNKTHISAMLSGRRGIGDPLASKLEAAAEVKRREAAKATNKL